MILFRFFDLPPIPFEVIKITITANFWHMASYVMDSLQAISGYFIDLKHVKLHPRCFAKPVVAFTHSFIVHRFDPAFCCSASRLRLISSMLRRGALRRCFDGG